VAERILFGEFLVHKGLIKSNAILSLLIDQIRSQPSVAEIVYLNKLLTEPQQLQVLRLQSRTGWDYQQACVELKYWSEKVALVVAEKSAKTRVQLGQLIVSKGLMTPSDLTRALDEFVGLCETDGSSSVQSTRKPPAVPDLQLSSVPGGAAARNNVIPIGISPALSVSEPHFTTVDPILLTEFLELLPVSRLKEMSEITKSWNVKIQNGETDLVIMELSAIAREMDSIRGAARFIRAELVERLMHLGTTTIELLIAKPEFVRGKIGKISATCYEIYNSVWTIRGVLISERSELSFWNFMESRKAYEETLHALQSIASLSVA
jgi:hypothetical protein